MDTKKDPFQNLQERMRNALADHSIRAFQELSSSTRDLMSCYRCAIMEIETKFRVLNERFSLQHDRNPIDSIQSRLKSPDSILDKMLRKKLPFIFMLGSIVTKTFFRILSFMKSAPKSQSDFLL